MLDILRQYPLFTQTAHVFSDICTSSTFNPRILPNSSAKQGVYPKCVLLSVAKQVFVAIGLAGTYGSFGRDELIRRLN